MCEICSVKKGDVELLVWNSVNVNIGGREFEEHALNIYINHMNDDYSISADYMMDDKWPVASVAAPIRYCPFCGRKLTDEVEKQYPWSK